jgi:hypothetical protein
VVGVVVVLVVDVVVVLFVDVCDDTNLKTDTVRII